MYRRIGALGVALAVVMASVAIAQQKPAAPTKGPPQALPAKHAAIGTIKQVDAVTSTIVVTAMGGTDQSYIFGPKTIVRGLPGITGVPALGKKLGDKVVLHFGLVGGKAEVHAIEYLGPVEIQQFAGTVATVNTKARTVTIKPADGALQEFVVPSRAALDLKRGIVAFSELTHLTNLQVTVYYSMRGSEKLVWYLQEAGTPQVSLR